MNLFFWRKKQESDVDKIIDKIKAAAAKYNPNQRHEENKAKVRGLLEVLDRINPDRPDPAAQAVNLALNEVKGAEGANEIAKLAEQLRDLLAEEAEKNNKRGR